jgi:hypothetical protein
MSANRLNLTKRHHRVEHLKKSPEEINYGNPNNIYPVNEKTPPNQQLSNVNLRKIQTRKRGYFGRWFNKIRGKANPEITQENVNRFQYNQLKNKKRGLFGRVMNRITRKKTKQHNQNIAFLLQPTS